MTDENPFDGNGSIPKLVSGFPKEDGKNYMTETDESFEIISLK